MMSLLGQASTGMSGEWANPNSWVSLVQVIGIPTFILLGILFLLYKVLKWVFGEEGWGKKAADRVADSFASAAKKVEECLPRLETSLSSGAAKTDKQIEFCQRIHAQGGEANVKDIKRAAHIATDMLGNLALRDSDNQQLVIEQIERIHIALGGNHDGT